MFQKFTTAIVKFGCKVGLHDFEWSYISTNACNQLGKCKREGCEGTKERTTHIWGNWHYIENNSCAQKRVCSRCQTIEERVEHIWGFSRYEKEGDCQKISTCQRCNEIRFDEIEHIWEPYQYESETSCHQVAYCRRCNEIKDHPEDYSHKWNDWVVDYQTMHWKRMCAHCGAEEFGNRAPSPKPTKVINNNIHNHEQVIIRPEGNRQVFIDKRNSRKRN